MSYSIQSPCFNCTKKSTCTDIKKITEAVQAIHETTRAEGHQGSGYITLTCIMQNKE